VTTLVPPPGADAVPAYEGGWVVDGGPPQPFLSYVEADPSVNWSDELEALHEEASRSHFIDQWTRGAIVDGIGPLGEHSTILDVGCSTGYLLEDLRAAHPSARLIGVDLIAAGLRKAHAALPEVRLLHADACALPLADGSVDAVVSANLLEHVPDDRRALAEIARVLVAHPANPHPTSRLQIIAWLRRRTSMCQRHTFGPASLPCSIIARESGHGLTG
jgi:SAM-dependent methyltransferase